MSKDYYKILGVEKSASQKDIKSSFYSLKKGVDPESDPYKDLYQAYVVISNPKLREKYDLYGETYEDRPKKFSDWLYGTGISELGDIIDLLD